MKNFIFISPHFPSTYWHFLKELKEDGFRVLGIGDAPWYEVNEETKRYLDEYYVCWDMENFDNEVEAVRYFENKYGHIDYLESNSEFWLERDARLRDIFNINGLRSDLLREYQHKSLMKKRYEKAGVKTARYILVDTLDNLKKFAKEVGFPIFAKPDIGVGAAGDYKIKNMDDLESFYKDKDPNVIYICEQYVTGNIVTFDGVCDSESKPIFAASEVFPPSISDVVKSHLDVFYYCQKEIPADLAKIGPAVLKAFEVKNRFFHLEFFRLTQDIKGLGKVGDIVALETNMRCPGGFTPDLLNYANSVDCYKVFADSIAFNKSDVDMNKEKFFAACASRRDEHDYFYSDDEVLNTWKDHMCQYGRYPDIFSGAMGNRYFMAKFKTLKELETFRDYVAKRVGEPVKTPKTSKKLNKGPICDTHVDGA